MIEKRLLDWYEKEVSILLDQIYNLQKAVFEELWYDQKFWTSSHFYGPSLEKFYKKTDELKTKLDDLLSIDKKYGPPSILPDHVNLFHSNIILDETQIRVRELQVLTEINQQNREKHRQEMITIQEENDRRERFYEHRAMKTRERKAESQAWADWNKQQDDWHAHMARIRSQ